MSRGGGNGAAAEQNSGRGGWRWAFFILNAVGLAVLIALAAGGRRVPSELMIVRVDPSGQVRHDRPVAVSVEFGTPLDPATVTPEALCLVPAAPGRLEQTDPRTLTLLLDEPLRRATRYQIALSPALAGHGGERLGEHRLEFTTEALNVVGIRQAGVMTDQGVTLELEFSADVNPEELRSSLTLSDADSHAVDFEPVGGKPARRLQIRIPVLRRDRLKLCLARGLAGIDGPLGLSEPYEAMVRILGDSEAASPPPAPPGVAPERVVDVTPGLRFLGMQADFLGSMGVITIKTNSPLDPARAETFVRIEPDVAHGFKASSAGLRIEGEFQAGMRYRVTLGKGLPAGEAGALQQEISRAVWFPDRDPALRFSFGGGYLTPQGLLTVPIHSVNVKQAELSVSRLLTSNVVEHVLTGERLLSGNHARMLGARTLDFADAPNEETETLLDLREIAEAKPRGVYALSLRGRGTWRSDRAVIVVTNLGLSARLSANRALCWVTSLADAQPEAGVRVSLYSDRRQELGSSVTDENGLAEIALPRLPPDEEPAMLLAEQDGDMSYLAFASCTRSRGRDAAQGRAFLAHGYEAFVTTERGVYRPGDDAQIAAFVRDRDWRSPGEMPVDLVVLRPDGRELLRRRALCDPAGRLSESVALPVGAASGYYPVQIRLPGKTNACGETGFRVADYIPQTLRMTLQAPQESVPAADGFSVRASVEHLFGGPARGLTVRARVRHAPAPFAPANWRSFIFGDSRVRGSTLQASLGDRTLDDSGTAVFRVEAYNAPTPAAIRAVVEVEAQEAGGRALSERIARTLHPHTVYLGLKPPHGRLQPRETAAFDLVALEPDGTQHDQELAWTATLYAVHWSNVLRKLDDGRLTYDWTRREQEETKLRGTLLGGAQLQLAPQRPGAYRLVVEANGACAVVHDFEVSGPGGAWLAHDPEEIRITLDRATYSPGETATASLQAPFAGTALVCIERDEVLSRRIVPLVAGQNELVFPVGDDWRPGVFVTATLVRPVQPEDDWRPHRAAGVARLPVSCEDRTLAVTVVPRGQVRPAQTMTVRVSVKNAAAEPVAGAAVVFAAVDEGVLALTGFEAASPWAFFYAPRRLDLREIDMYDRLAPELARWRAGREPDPGGDGEAKAIDDLSRRLNPIDAKRVHTAVLYAGNAVTDHDGTAELAFTLPEYVGELRLMAFVAHEDAFGLAESPLPVRSPLMLRASWPRFLAVDDECDVAVTLLNRTEDDGKVRLQLATDETLQPARPLPETVPVSAGGEVTLHLRLKAARVGKATPRLRVTLGDESYAESCELPIRPASGFVRRTETVRIEPGKTRELILPEGFLPDTVRASVAVCGHPLAEVGGSVDYLLSYPYGCLEQTTSRLLPLIYLRDLADLVRPESVGEEEVDAVLEAGWQRLRMMQTYGGGLAMWPGLRDPHDWGTLYALDLLLEARRAGHAVPDDLLDDALAYVETRLQSWVSHRDAQNRPDRLSSAAYGCYVLTRAGRRPHGWMARLEELVLQADREGQPVRLTTRCHLATAYLAAGEAEAARAFVTAAPAVPATDRDAQTFDSPLRERAILLQTLLDVEPDSPRIPALVDSLKVQLADPWWGTTQENAFALLALGKYARNVSPDRNATAHVTVGEEELAFPAIHGRTFTPLAPGAKLTIRQEGASPLFAYMHIEGVPLTGAAEESDEGLRLRRALEELDGAPVAGPLRQGELYRVVLRLQAEQPVSDVVLTDLLPAGLEIEHQDLLGSARLGGSERQSRLRPVHVERRDDRLLIFTDIPGGASSYSYIVRAVTTGRFVHPAAEAAAMYAPGIHSAHGRAVVEVVK